jgi:hypothetical protein
MKTRINAALALLNDLHQVGHIRDEGNVKFQAAKQELEAALAMPDPICEPLPANDPDIVALNNHLSDVVIYLAELDSRIDVMNGNVAALVAQNQPA